MDIPYSVEQEMMDQMLESQVADLMHEKWLRKKGYPVEEQCGYCYSEREHTERQLCKAALSGASDG